MHLFLSAGEPSGDLHGANLARELLARNPAIELVGFGGDRMAAAGVKLHFPLADLSVMGVKAVFKHLPTFFKLARQAEVYFRSRKPDAVVLIDYPGFNFALMNRAFRSRIPVYYYVPPQVWAWHTSRVKQMRRQLAGVLTALPFEDDWYRSHGCRTSYIGHPYFDELQHQRPDEEWMADRRAAGGRIVALLPGSRGQEVAANGRLMIDAAKVISSAVPTARFLVAAFKEQHARSIRELLVGSSLPVEVHVGRTPEIIRLAEASLAVSGSVGLELLGNLVPTVVVYKTSRAFAWLATRVSPLKYMSLVNLLADRPLFPEVGGGSWTPAQVAGPVIRWLTDPAARDATVSDLRELRSKVAVPGACGRAAEFLLADLARIASQRA